MTMRDHMASKIVPVCWGKNSPRMLSGNLAHSGHHEAFAVVSHMLISAG